MKKLIALLLLLTLATTLIACTPKQTETLNVGYLSGPTGMGMAKMINDNKDGEKYTFSLQDQNAALVALQNGELDIICLPTNLAAQKYNTDMSNIVVLAINCLNSLFVISNSDEANITTINDLAGKTVYTCLQGTPRLILQHLVNELSLDVTIKTEFDGKTLTTPQDLQATLIANPEDLDIAVLPEPLVSAVGANTKNAYAVRVDLADAWSTISDSPIAMGCIVARADFVAENEALVREFLEEYKASIEFMSNPENIDSASQYVADAKIMGAQPLAKKALANLGDSIAYVDGSNMKGILEYVFGVFGNKVIGGKLPDDSFYYEK